MMDRNILTRARQILAQAKQEPTNQSTGQFEPSTPEGILIEPAAPHAKPVYWETADSRILGPAVPECLARDGDTFWIATTFEGQIRWINSDRLRSRKAFEEQAEIQEVEPIRSF